MGMILDASKVTFEKKVYENELENLKKHLNGVTEKLTVDMSACDDLHGSIVQFLLAHKARYDSDYIFNDKSSTFKMALQGFRNVENNCN
jgi:hypothetical protein